MPKIQKYCEVGGQYGKDNNKELHFYCKFCGQEMGYDEKRICTARQDNQEKKFGFPTTHAELNSLKITNQEKNQWGETCCCLSYERGVTPCMCQCHNQQISKSQLLEVLEEIKQDLLFEEADDMSLIIKNKIDRVKQRYS